MKNQRITAFVLLWLAILSVACSLFNAPIATPTPDIALTYKPVTDPLVIEPASLPEAQLGVVYDIELRVFQNVTPVADMWIKEGSLPGGLEFVFLNGEDAAKISGIPQNTGIYSFTIYVGCYGTMVAGQTLEMEYQIVVNESLTAQAHSTQVMETAVSQVRTEVAKTQSIIPTETSTPVESNWNYKYIPVVSAASVVNSSQEEIASLLFIQWLNHFKTDEADLDHQLDDFELLSVVIREEQSPDIFVAMVTFSVKPIRMTSWVAGNGIADGAWVRRKLLFISVKKENDKYGLISMGTGP